MAFPTLENVYDAIRMKLGDDEVSGGQIYTNTRLLGSVQHAVRDLFRVMAKVGNPRVIKNVYYNLPAYTSVLRPSTAGISDMGDPIGLWARGNVSTLSVSSATPGSSSLALVTSTAHGLSSGDLVTLYLPGVVGGDGHYAVTVTSSTGLTINGLVASGSYTSGGTVTVGSDAFSPVYQATDSPNLEHVSLGEVSEFAWHGDVFHVPAVSAIREIRIEYYSSATVPTQTTDVIAVDDCIDFLACRSAALAAKVRSPNLSRIWNVEALGPKEMADGSGGMLRDLLQAGVRALQEMAPEERMRQPFRFPEEYSSSVG